MQVNLAGGVPYESRVGLSASLGNAGEAHTDKRDDPEKFTAMLAMGDIDTLHPGFFFLLELGVYIYMANYRVVHFSGLQRHGGSPPRARRGEDVPAWATRMTVIWYPSLPAMTRESAFVDGFLGKHCSVDVQPRYAIDPELKKTIKKQHLNFFRDGLSVMERNCYEMFALREMILVNSILFDQVDGLHFDASQFAKCVYRLSESGERIYCTDNWSYAPGLQDEQSLETLAEVERERTLAASLISGQVALGKRKRGIDDDGGRPRPQPKPKGKMAHTFFAMTLSIAILTLYEKVGAGHPRNSDVLIRCKAILIS